MDEVNLNAAFSAAVRRFHETKNMTSEEFSKELGIGKTSLLQIEKGLCNPTLSTVQTVAAHLGCDPRMLFGGPIQADLLVAQYLMMCLEHGHQFSSEGIQKAAQHLIAFCQIMLEEYARIQGQTPQPKAGPDGSASQQGGQLL